jgi:hypothetical protein
VFIACLLSYAGISKAQVWKLLGTQPTAMYCAYFYDTTLGVVAGVGSIWYLKHGYWNTATTPSDDPSYFTSIRELKPGVLYATSGASYVWVSTDSGASWKNTNTAGSFAYDSYLAQDSVHAAKSGSFARLDSNICIETNLNGEVPSYSSDGGKTWKTPTGYSNIGGFGSFADTCRKMFFATSRGVGYPSYYSLDSGHSWKTCGPNLVDDILNGADGTVYRQDTSGVWVSLDAGTSWQFLAGPKATGGERGIFGFGPKGKYIIAMSGGGVWLFTHADTVRPTDPITRGDTLESCPVSRVPVTVRAFTRPFQINMQPFTLGPQSMSPADTTFEIQPGAPITVWYTVSPSKAQQPTFVDLYTTASDGCSQFQWLDTFTLVTVPLPMKTPNVKLQNCEIPRIPLAIYSPNQALRMFVSFSADSGWSVTPADTSINLEANFHDTLWLNPTAPSLPIGTLVHLQAYDTVACTIYTWDTAFTVSIVPEPINWSWIDSLAIHACDSVMIPVAFGLASCDSLSLDSLTVTPPDGRVTFATTPGQHLERGATDTLWLRFAPHGKDDTTKYGLNIFSHFVPENIPFDTTLSFRASSFGAPHPRVSAASALSLTSCDAVTVPVYIKAAGCENIRIDSIGFNNPGVIVSGGLSKPDTIFEGTTDTVRFTVEPLYPSIEARALDFYCFLDRFGDLTSLDTMITVALNVSGENTQPLVTEAPKFSLSNCSTATIPVILHAPCDSAIISSCDVTATNGVNFTTNLSFPRTLHTGESDTLLISFPPQGLNLTAQVYAHVHGAYGGALTTFDTTPQTQVTFACADGVTARDRGMAPLVLSDLKTSEDQLVIGLTKNDPNIIACQAEIASVLGDVVDKRSFPLSASQNQLSLNVSSLASGVYYLRIISGDDFISSRFVLIK